MKKGDTYQHRFHITEKVYEDFVQFTNDKNPLHTNESFARQKGFRSTVMHGNILCGFLSFFVGECLPVKAVMILSQEIRFSRPIFMNDYLSLEASVCDVYESVNVVEFAFKFEKEKNELVAMGTLKIKLLK